MLSILGGSFDPIHNGHLGIASALLEDLPFSEICFIPCGQHAFHKIFSTTPQQRIDMLQLALQDHPKLTLDTREINSHGISYTINTLQQLRQEYEETLPIAFILGFDAFLRLPQWRQWQQLTDYAHLIVFNRAEYSIQTDTELAPFIRAHLTKNKQALCKKQYGCIYFYTTPIPFYISSAKIRRKVQQHIAINDEVPVAVAEYIQQHKLYLI